MIMCVYVCERVRVCVSGIRGVVKHSNYNVFSDDILDYLFLMKISLDIPSFFLHGLTDVMVPSR